jgi:hypothetical protein
MRTTFNSRRLRLVATLLLVLGGGCVALATFLPLGSPLPLAGMALGSVLVAVALKFWGLSRDRRAGVIVDSKGLLLNLGHSSAFISWANIERAGTSTRVTSLLTIGSRRQLGIALRDVRPYIQSYEERLPSGSGAIGDALRRAQQLLRARHPLADEELALHLAMSRRRTGYDVVIPEALLGQPAHVFIELIEERRRFRAGTTPNAGLPRVPQAL